MNEIIEVRDFSLLRKGDRVRLYQEDEYKDGIVTLGGKVGSSGCFVDYNDGTKGIHCPEELVKLKIKVIRSKTKSIIPWCEVTCLQCGTFYGFDYKNTKTISKLRRLAKDWVYHPDYGNLCPKCQEKLINQK